MLIGQFDGKISIKHQVAFPKKFRQILGDKFIVTKGFEQALMVIAESNWTKVLEDIEESSVTRSSARETKRFLLGGASYIDLDDKGRFILPEYLRMFADLSEEIVFVGQDSYVEIWDKKRWDKYNAELATKIESIAEKLSVSARKEDRNE
ncbi:MAG TPA: division/cell wall cluster transcriptional repressor MraZ [Patescibacteria group bacterium]